MFIPVNPIVLAENVAIDTELETVIAKDNDSSNSPDGQVTYLLIAANDSKCLLSDKFE